MRGQVSRSKNGTKNRILLRNVLPYFFKKVLCTYIGKHQVPIFIHRLSITQLSQNLLFYASKTERRKAICHLVTLLGICRDNLLVQPASACSMHCTLMCFLQILPGVTVLVWSIDDVTPMFQFQWVKTVSNSEFRFFL